MNPGKDGKLNRNLNMQFLKTPHEDISKDEEEHSKELNEDLAGFIPAENFKKPSSLNNSMSESESSSEDDDKKQYGTISICS